MGILLGDRPGEIPCYARNKQHSNAEKFGTGPEEAKSFVLLRNSIRRGPLWRRALLLTESLQLSNLVSYTWRPNPPRLFGSDPLD